MWKKASDKGTTSADWGPLAALAAGYVPYSPIVARPRLTWPGDARVALWIVPNVEYYEFVERPNDHRSHYDPRLPQPQVAKYAYYDYGNRVGFWRMLEVLDNYPVPITCQINVAVLDHHPELAEAMAERDWAFMGHGVYNTQFLLAGQTSEDEERALLADQIDTIRRTTGRAMKGYFGPGGTVTPSTMELLSEAGVTYTADWFLDDQPFPILVRSGDPLIGVPYSIEVNDGPWLSPNHGRSEGAAGLLQAYMDQFDTLYREGAESGRVMCVPLHPWLIGRPQCVQYLDRALDYIMSHDGVWAATAEEIADHYRLHHLDGVLRNLEETSGVAL